MIITIFSGGSGSLEIQNGLHKMFGTSGLVDVHVVINGYDDGKSTGDVRHIYGDTILGPSDLRKNQVYRHELLHGPSTLSQFLKTRFDAPDTQKAYEYVQLLLRDLVPDHKTYCIFSHYIHTFFEKTKATKGMSFEFKDFNVGNMVYASMLHGLGVDATIRLMDSLLKLPVGRVLFQSNETFRLVGETESGVILNDEASIVNFSNKYDKIRQVKLLHPITSKETTPTLEPVVVDLLNRTDLIIFSCGTLWSSLIPSFISKHFDVYLKRCFDMYLIVNASPDKDTLALSDEEYVKLLARYLPLDCIQTVYVETGLIRPPAKMPFPHIVLPSEALISPNKHNGFVLCKHIFRHVFRVPFSYTHHVYDYDYTLYTPQSKNLNDTIFEEWRQNKHPKTILTRNHFRNIESRYHEYPIYSQFGIWSHDLKQYTCPEFLLTKSEKVEVYQKIWELIDGAAIDNPVSIADREITICVKPLTPPQRQICSDYLNKKLTGLKCTPTGKTSIEIMKADLDKDFAYKWLCRTYQHESIFYISDEDDIQCTKDKWIVPPPGVYVFIRCQNIIDKSCFPDLIIVAGGKNTRNSGRPKLLMTVPNKDMTILEQTISVCEDYVRNIYIFTSQEYAVMIPESPKYKKVVVCGDEGTRGSLETVYLGVTKASPPISKSGQTLIMWSDCVLPDSRLVAELSCKYGPFIIPTEHVESPYAYIVADKGSNHVKEIRLQSRHPIAEGYHDLSIFNVQLRVLLPVMAELVSKDCKQTTELALFDAVPVLRKQCKDAVYYESRYPSFSFNSQSDMDNGLS